MQFETFEWLNGRRMPVITTCPGGSRDEIVFWLVLQNEINIVQEYFFVALNNRSYCIWDDFGQLAATRSVGYLQLYHLVSNACY